MPAEVKRRVQCHTACNEHVTQPTYWMVSAVAAAASAASAAAANRCIHHGYRHNGYHPHSHTGTLEKRMERHPDTKSDVALSMDDRQDRVDPHPLSKQRTVS